MLTQLKSMKLPLALLTYVFLKFLTLSLLPPWTGSLSIDAKYDYPGSQIYAGRSVLCRLRLQVQYPLRFSLSTTCEIKFEWAGSLVFGPTIHAVHMIVCPLCNLRALENLNLVPYHRYSTLWKHVSQKHGIFWKTGLLWLNSQSPNKTVCLGHGAQLIEGLLSVHEGLRSISSTIKNTVMSLQNETRIAPAPQE